MMVGELKEAFVAFLEIPVAPVAALYYLWLGHAIPGLFWRSVPTFFLAPKELLTAVCAGAIDTDLGPIWRPVMWGSIFYVGLLFILLDLEPEVLRPLDLEPEVLRMLDLEPKVLRPLVWLVLGWLATCPVMLPLWLYLHDSFAATGSYLFGDARAPGADEWIAVVLAVCHFLGHLIWADIPTAEEPPSAYIPIEIAAETQPQAASGSTLGSLTARLRVVIGRGRFRASIENAGEKAAEYFARVGGGSFASSFRLFDPSRSFVNDLTEKRRLLVENANRHHGPTVGCEVRADRARLLESSLGQLRTKDPAELLGQNFKVRFAGEFGIDQGGVTRDWFDSVAKALDQGSDQAVRHDDPTFAQSSLLARERPRRDPDGAPSLTLLPRPSGFQGPSGEDAPPWLKSRWADVHAVGRFLALAVLKDQPLPLSFGSELMKFFCGQSVSYTDAFRLDEDFYQYRIKYILEDGGLARAAEEVGEPLMFMSAPTDLEPEAVPLKEGGESTEVTESNKMEYISLLSEARICGGRRFELQLLIAGFHDLIPEELLRTVGVTPLELALLISGSEAGYNINDWKAHSETRGDAVVLGWFWQVLESFSPEQRAKVLYFTTGSSRLPAGGFARLHPKFKVITVPSPTTYLPVSHTCSRCLELPRYTSKEQLCKKLLGAIESQTFGLQ